MDNGTTNGERTGSHIMVYSGPMVPEEERWIRDCVCKLGKRYGEVRLSKLMLQRALREGENPVAFVQRVIEDKCWPVTDEGDAVLVTAGVEGAL